MKEETTQEMVQEDEWAITVEDTEEVAELTDEAAFIRCSSCCSSTC